MAIGGHVVRWLVVPHGEAVDGGIDRVGQLVPLVLGHPEAASLATGEGGDGPAVHAAPFGYLSMRQVACVKKCAKPSRMNHPPPALLHVNHGRWCARLRQVLAQSSDQQRLNLRTWSP